MTDEHNDIVKMIPGLMRKNHCADRLGLALCFARKRWAWQCMRIITLASDLPGDDDMWDRYMPWLAANLDDSIMEVTGFVYSQVADKSFIGAMNALCGFG